MKFGPVRLLAGAPSGVKVGSATRSRIAVAGIGRIGVDFADARHRAPELVVVLRFPDGDAGIGHRRVDERQQAGELDDVRAPSCRRSASRSGCRAAAARRGSACRRRPRRFPISVCSVVRSVGVDDPVAAERLHLGERARIGRPNSSAGGGGARNCALLVITNGVTSSQSAPSASGAGSPDPDASSPGPCP